MVWAIKDMSISSTFVDGGAAQFFLPHLSEEKKEASVIVKRQKYMLEEGTFAPLDTATLFDKDHSSVVTTLHW